MHISRVFDFSRDARKIDLFLARNCEKCEKTNVPIFGHFGAKFDQILNNFQGKVNLHSMQSISLWNILIFWTSNSLHNFLYWFFKILFNDSFVNAIRTKDKNSITLLINIAASLLENWSIFWSNLAKNWPKIGQFFPQFLAPHFSREIAGKIDRFLANF